MKFGETFREYLRGDQENKFLDKCSHVEYKRLKKVLKRCRVSHGSQDQQGDEEPEDNSPGCGRFCNCESCPAGCFSSRARRLLHLHMARGMQGYVLRVRQCFRDDKLAMAEEGRMLMEYVTMNAIAIRKILKKYDKVHSSVNGNIFKSKMRAEHIELLQSPWLIELGALLLNFNGLNGGRFSEFCGHFSCDLDASEPVMKLTLPNSVTIEYSLTCAICLEMVFHPYALSCGHLFCKSCACSAAFVPIFLGLKQATPDSKCSICREVGVYQNAVPMTELDLLLKRRCRENWKERMAAERALIVKQTKEYWDMQTKYAIGY
ncbi:Probable E3 ubiquitin-protein ligase BAH1-like 1 [Linum grandiflorum]